MEHGYQCNNDLKESNCLYILLSVCLLQRLEETCERVSVDKGISVMKKDPASAAFVPLRVKEIGRHIYVY